jgi:hypothetical protein
MKKQLLILLLLTLALIQSLSAITPNPIISRGKAVYTSSGSAAYLVDNKFGSSQWTVHNDSWIAIQLDAGPTRVFFNWNNPAYPWSNELAPSQCPNNIGFPVDYDLLTSSNSTDGIDGDWTIMDSIRGNIVSTRAHMIDFTGASWIKMHIITGGGTLDEVEIFDASESTDDTWFFAGTSISANAFKGTPPAINFADNVHAAEPDFSPLMVRGGIGCISSSDMVSNISSYLEMAGNIHFWAIEMGTNDAWGGTNANVTVFKNNLQVIIDSCKAHGIEPIIARILATRESDAGWQVHPDFEQAVDDLTSENGLIPGPDLYTWFLTHPEEINPGSTDGVHPNADGAASIQKLWAQKMDSLYGGCSYVPIIPHLQINGGESEMLASPTVYERDTLILSPDANVEGNWSWAGPGGYTANTREIEIDSIKKEQAGTYTVTLTVSDTCTFNLAFKVKVMTLVGLHDNQLSDHINIFPNPTKDGSFTVMVENISGTMKLQILDTLGKVAYSTQLEQKETRIHAALPCGIYFITITYGEESIQDKLVIE